MGYLKSYHLFAGACVIAITVLAAVALVMQVAQNGHSTPGMLAAVAGALTVLLVGVGMTLSALITIREKGRW